MKLPILLSAYLLSVSAFAQTPVADIALQTRQIEEVVEAFRASIVDKDRDRFIGLFLHERITWQSVKSDDRLRRVRLEQPSAAKVNVDHESNYLSFIDSIVASKDGVEEKFSNVKIDTDGDIGSVYFDYSFHSGGRETNRGKESWQLVKTEGGWRIVAVVWSIHSSVEP